MEGWLVSNWIIFLQILTILQIYAKAIEYLYGTGENFIVLFSVTVRDIRRRELSIIVLHTANADF